MPELGRDNLTDVSLEQVFENRPVEIVILTYAAAIALINVGLLYTTIWHGRFGSDNKKTLVDLLNSLACWIIIFYSLVTQVPTML